MHGFEMSCAQHLEIEFKKLPLPEIGKNQNMSKSSQDTLSLSLQKAELERIKRDTLPPLEPVEDKNTKKNTKTKSEKNGVKDENVEASELDQKASKVAAVSKTMNPYNIDLELFFDL